MKSADSNKLKDERNYQNCDTKSVVAISFRRVVSF